MYINKILSIILVIAGLLLPGSMQCQFASFTPFNNTPVHLNPAFNGIFNSKYRLSIQYKNQGRSFLKENAYQDYFADAEMRLNAFGHDQWSVGLSLANSVAGASKFQNSQVMINTAYLKKLAGNNYLRTAHYLSAGLQIGAGQRRISQGNYLFGDQINPITGKPEWESIEQIAHTRQYWDFNAGLAWYFVDAKRYSLTAGIAVWHLNSPLVSILPDGIEELKPGWSLTLNGNFLIGDHFSLEPAVIWKYESIFHNIYVGTQFNTGNFDGSDMTLSLGAWLRSGLYIKSFLPGSFIITASVKKSQVQIGLGINFSINEIQMADEGFGALEFSAIFLIGELKTKHNLLCPDL